MVARVTDSATSVATESRLLVDSHETEPESLANYQGRGGYAAASWNLAPDALIELIATSGLRGRGGAIFPTGRKWRAVAAQPGQKVVLINAAESEPASRKDRTLLTRRPHLVIEGALLAARTIGAEECVLYCHAPAGRWRASEIEDAFKTAWRELERAGWHLPRCRIVRAPRGYVAGEETAAVQRCNGRAAKPTFKPPLPYQRGVAKRPTLVQNVETLANVPLIARRGAAWFRSVGTPELPGTLLVTLAGAVRFPGVYEVPSGIPLDRLLTEQGGGLPEGAQAILTGGYFGGWLSGSALTTGVTLDPASLAEHKVALASAAIVVVPETVCGLAQATQLLRFFADESAKQCGPCTYGTQAMAETLARIERGESTPGDLAHLERWATQVLPRRGACGHLDGAAVACATALHVFHDEIERHAGHARGVGCGRPHRIVLPGLTGLDGEFDDGRN